jgi:hypothetical protein
MQAGAVFIGLILTGYGVWFTVRGIGMVWGDRKDWWRPMDRKSRYPYPVAGLLLGVCFVLFGLRYTLHFTWASAPMLGYAGGGLFVIVLLAGIIQPRFLHPRWYGDLEDRLGKKAVARLRAKAHRLDGEEWLEITASKESFDEWVDDALPHQPRQSRGFKRGE